MCVLYQKYCKYTIRICDWLRVSRGFALQDQSLSGYSISKKTNKKKEQHCTGSIPLSEKEYHVPKKEGSRQHHWMLSSRWCHTRRLILNNTSAFFSF